MIIRILGEGQFDVPDSELDALNVLDERLVTAIGSDDEEAFHAAVDALLGRVRELGSTPPADRLAPSDLVLPAADTTLTEVRGLLGDEGLIPG
ncbi:MULTISPECIES: hypothetical protein [unclassified Parafrankia]|uniref:PspA-associated protein PspAA n=1 Tax=unclassified Parafrankia TaxID=2994368 RepID=UPI00005437CA|nr:MULTISPECIES: hypothetical protein [unclassified Parafrankia]ABW11963.1 conserved hypothetical protein [Frankia sp. EAN1pec]TCJ40070.1 hypothetical protein E0504_06670 [Parafrankia sp. BMG5.11]CAI7975181.1 conserved hypothetical protein [Frankia sp. Hr75.2]SQD94547.1 conserved hypothetical protein [Parafrankia sp. Ea1.12]